MSPTFRVGDRVRVPLGRGKVPGVITEDRGAIGYRGRHLYEVRVFMDPFEPTTYELAGEEIEAVDEPTEPTTMGKDQIANYLINGGLISILRSNLSGGGNPPRVWLCPDSLGNVTHTFHKERGLVGGAEVPSMAVEDDRIFVPKRDEVLEYLQSFGLDRHEAEEIIASVGTAPRRHIR